MSEAPQTGPAGLPMRPYVKRCNFGHGHVWIAARDEEIYQCATCGRMSSNIALPLPTAIGGETR